MGRQEWSLFENKETWGYHFMMFNKPLTFLSPQSSLSSGISGPVAKAPCSNEIGFDPRSEVGSRMLQLRLNMVKEIKTNIIYIYKNASFWYCIKTL